MGGGGGGDFIPSGPGLLRDHIVNKAARISLSEGIALREALSLLEIEFSVTNSRSGGKLGEDVRNILK